MGPVREIILFVLMNVSLSKPFVPTTVYQAGRKRHPSATARSIAVVDGPFDPLQLQGYWCRAPLLIRNANLQVLWPTDQDILDLAVDPVAGESARWIRHRPAQWDSFELDMGPFDDDFVDDIDKDERWTVVVNDVDRYLPDLANWLDYDFGFLPRWRRDDAQVSLAGEGGGIGPHVDNYDVFLIQTSGRRSWKIAMDRLSVEEEMDALVKGIDVRILDGCYDYEEVILEPDDILYLPPRVVHWGTALDDGCMTLSVGCRAPSAAELVARIAENLSTSVRQAANQRYTDELLSLEPLGFARGPSLSDETRQSMRDLVRAAVDELLEDDMAWDEIVGTCATEPKRFSASALIPYDELGDDDFYDTWGRTGSKALRRVCSGIGGLRRAPGLSFATSSLAMWDRHMCRLYCNGMMWEVNCEGRSLLFFELIERGQLVTGRDLEWASDELIQLIEELIEEGIIYPTETN